MNNKFFILIFTCVTLEGGDCVCRDLPTQPNIDGFCNNRKNEIWGATNSPFLRMCDESEYDDCIVRNRPGAQDVCDEFIEIADEDESEGTHSLFLTFFGQFLDHDLTLTKHATRDCTMGTDITDICEIDACDEDIQCRIVRNINVTKPECFPFTRSQADATGEQRNLVTSYMDLSNVYASTFEDSCNLRTYTNGQLITEEIEGCSHRVLPEGPEKDGKFQFLGGDTRMNENPILMAFHTLFVLEHNMLAAELKERYYEICNTRRISDQTLFDVARRINIAQWQSIIVYEYLAQLNIKLPKRGYNKKLNAGIFQEFSTAAYRFGHSEVKNNIKFHNKDTNSDEVKSLRDLFFETEIFKNYCLEGVLSPQWQTVAEKLDNKFAKSVGEKLFIPTSKETNNTKSLCALNVQRGRDHRLGSYPCVLEICELKEKRIISKSVREKLEIFYDSKDLSQVDIFITGLLEKPVGDGPLGATFKCILKKQFRRLIKGDRFYFENAEGYSSTQKENIVPEIKNRKMSDILCRHLNLEKVPTHVFQHPDDQGGEITCGDVQTLNSLDTWLEPFTTDCVNND